MIHYFDASALAKRYVSEPETEAVAKLLRRGTAATCRLTEVEVASALARRCREGFFSKADLSRALDALRRDVDGMNMVELSGEVVAVARQVLADHPVRAGDAVQLASCLVLQRRSRLAVTLVAFDARLAEAAATLGLELAP